MHIRMLVPLLGMIDGVTLPRDLREIIELPDHAAYDLIGRGCAERVSVPAVADDVEVRVTSAPEKRGPGRPPADK